MQERKYNVVWTEIYLKTYFTQFSWAELVLNVQKQKRKREVCKEESVSS